MKKTLGGDRLGSGKKLEVDMHNYARSTHDKSYIFRTTMSSGTLVPFLKQVALPGDTFDIDLDCDIKTHPTIGPLFGSYKVQLDIFLAPVRLYQGQLHNNKLGIGMKMANVKLPFLALEALPILNADVPNIDMDNVQINPSCILSYLGIRGVGYTEEDDTFRAFNGVPLLAYWDIYKNYYANKQEDIGAVIHSEVEPDTTNVVEIVRQGPSGTDAVQQAPAVQALPLQTGDQFTVEVTPATTQDLSQVIIYLANGVAVPLTDLGIILNFTADIYTLLVNQPIPGIPLIRNWDYAVATQPAIKAPIVQTFPLSEIDDMREQILAAATTSTAFDINATNLKPYDYLFTGVDGKFAIQQTQEGLAIKTYQSDLFNNWIQTEWIDGVDGISAITAVDTTGDKFTIDQLNLQKKVYDMLNRIAVSGGSYDDWQDAVWTHERMRRAESPMYMGGLIKELVFQEVVSNSESPATTDGNTQPLGTLAGKGVMAKKHKGGSITIKVDEPSYIIGIISLTPRIDYSQGNDWDTHLATMDDFHKPALDEIGFQELITEQMAWWDTTNITGNIEDWVTKSAGKQPAWINYMTEVNKVRGNFAIQSNEMFMTLNRRYEPVIDAAITKIKDLTTYIDPVKFNNIFAQTSLDAQNFWTQIAIDITYRGKISAKLIPNL